MTTAGKTRGCVNLHSPGSHQSSLNKRSDFGPIKRHCLFGHCPNCYRAPLPFVTWALQGTLWATNHPGKRFDPRKVNEWFATNHPGKCYVNTTAPSPNGQYPTINGLFKKVLPLCCINRYCDLMLLK